ncbi:phage-related protein [Pseudomonas sp. PvP046]
MHIFWYTPDMSNLPPTLTVKFFRTETGNEPVREWLIDLPRDDRKAVGTDIKTVQFGWPIGMPVVRKMEPDLWEVRIDLKEKIARVLFTVEARTMVLLHGFIKKSEKTPASDLETARQRKSALKRKR